MAGGGVNTVAYSGGRVCYPGFYDAVQGGVRENLPRGGHWWPGLDVDPRLQIEIVTDGRVQQRPTHHGVPLSDYALHLHHGPTT